jgi:hypothetical protein
VYNWEKLKKKFEELKGVGFGEIEQFKWLKWLILGCNRLWEPFPSQFSNTVRKDF